jgi:hypothetical protein
MEVIKEEVVSYDQMAIIEQYEKVIAYLYPIAQSIPRKHGVVRDMFLRALFKQTEMFYEAGKTNQIGKIYIADAGLAGLRFWLRFLVTPKVKGITKHQHETALVLIANVGSMVNSWVIKRKGQNG